MIRLDGVHKSYLTGKSRLHVLKGIDLTIEAGEMVSIMGSSGSGKSTLMNMLGLLDGYDEGTYHLDGTLVKGLSETRAATAAPAVGRLRLPVVQPDPVQDGGRERGAPALLPGRAAARSGSTLAHEYLERVGLAPWADHRPSEMSGGQQQRVAIARALVGAARRSSSPTSRRARSTRRPRSR